MKNKLFFILGKTINVLLDIVIVALIGILLISVYNNVQINIIGNSYSSFMGYSLFEVKTRSMEPVIEPGDWIIVKRQKDYELEDVITYEVDGKFITHRIVNKYGDSFVTRGDSNNANDLKPILKEQVVGKEIKILSSFGIMRKTIFNPVVLIGVLIIMFLTNSIFKKKTNNLVEHEVVRSLDKILKRDKKAKRKAIKNANGDQIGDVVVINEEEKIKLVCVNEDEDFEEKTMLFRMVSVDSEEIEALDNTSVLETVEERTQVLKPLDPNQEPEESDELVEEKVKIALELIQKKRKKCNNFIEKTMLLKREEIEEIVSLLNFKEKYKTNEPTIKDSLADIYMDAKYYNNFVSQGFGVNVKNSVTKVEKELLNCSVNLYKEYKGSDSSYEDKIKKFLKMILLINKLETDYVSISDIDKKKNVYQKDIVKYMKYKDVSGKEMKEMVSDILKIQKNYANMIKFLSNKIENGVFELSFEQINKQKMYFVDLEHNIQFSKVYSDYIVDKTYTEGLVAEDKIEVLATLLSAKLVKDMFAKSFENRYVVRIPKSLFSKDKKITKVMKIFNDAYAKKSIIFVIDLESINDNKKAVKSYIKDDFHFAVDLTNVNKLKKKDEMSLYLCDLMFVEKDNETLKEVLNSFSDDMTDKIIYTDVYKKNVK